ncbi:acyl-CoA dehydrogenase [Burkholderia sp. SFA1]|uniref:acyl-CoA dehydrogenase family protein n=1 Tax=unclassified Caballeronia TaxID=2646786 RepID=UPI000238887B|nr:MULTISPECIES: acyl-CoA dehydrogenase family protein [unclassified Caballeronia]AET89521.1 acyl-CoA dehydrogenase domain protein [Burkholderia sp. YI23]MCE4541429.1 acyl-CoA dehydrogenase family protein [Caballeronia sp. PC1]MCE4569527.1 acyl-CoA dehydrogenase family protein [Caballeronia sp. CLC5]BBP96680.1 acyl-CoA dehydrogenase [Burkholderia sp. SFA1]
MNFDYTPKVAALREKLLAFFDAHIYPNERAYADEIAANRASGNAWVPTRLIESLKERARADGLWNLFLPSSERGAGLTNLEYAPLCEIMGRVPWAPEVFNCSAPDTGNMETIERYGTDTQKAQWLEPLLHGEIRSAFLMTEPEVASSDATNIRCSIARDGDSYVIDGHKWWSSGAGDPRCKVYIVMGKTDTQAPKHAQQSMILVPADAPGITVHRPLNVFGYDDAPHGHMDITLDNVRVPAANLLLGEGRGFEIAQGRLGPGRIHHCMRLIGLAERALELMTKRTLARVAFGKPIAQHGVTQERIAEARIMIEQARLLTLKAAYIMDTAGNKGARGEIAMIKVVAPNVACQVIDWAIQAHGAGGVCDDFPLAYAYASARTLRLADGPDEVHRNAIAKLELGKYASGA